MNAEQQMLHRELCVRVDRATNLDALIHVAGDILHSLLRRKGDAEFLTLVQDALIEGLTGRDLAGQKELAREVIAVVLTKRPEIALAWQAMFGAAQVPAARRAADHTSPPVPPPAPSPPARLSLPPKPPYEYASAEKLAGDYVAEVLGNRLQIFKVTEPRFPCPAYWHEQPFFLFNPLFTRVACTFMVDVVMVECRPALERHLYRRISPAIAADQAQLADFMAEKRGDAWKILIERLTKLATHHRSAEGKVAAARDADPDEPEFCEVDVPVSHPRVLKVLGVEFVLGTEITTKRMKVRMKASTELVADEMHALDMITRLRDIAADEGLELPPGCDFLFLRTVLEFDAKKYAQQVKEIMALGAHEETSLNYLLERFKAIDDSYANYLSDALLLMVFADGGAGPFGFKELHDICIGTAAEKTAMVSKRPFLPAEIGRRPRELVYQLRESIKRRHDERVVGEAARQLLSVWSVMHRNRFEREMDVALTVLASFPVTFAGDPDEPSLARVGAILHDALTGKVMDVRGAAEAVMQAYAPILRRQRN